MKIILGNQKATSLTHRKQSKTFTPPILTPPDHLICRKPTSIPCSPIVVNQYQKLIKPVFLLISLMSIKPWGAPGQKYILSAVIKSLNTWLSLAPTIHLQLTMISDLAHYFMLVLYGLISYGIICFPTMPIILTLWTNTLLFIFMMLLLFAIWSIIICHMKTGVYLKWTLWEKNEFPLLSFEIEPTRHWTSWNEKWEKDDRAENDEPEADNIIG